MKIAVDVMGGDYAPQELVSGARSYLENGGDAELILVGRESAIREIMPELPKGCEIYDTPDFVEMGEAPMQALRKKKNASIAVAARLVREGKADALLSAGSTGAQMAASFLEIGRIPGVERPAIAVMLPSVDDHGVLLLDVGANVDSRANHLFQFAQMGSAYYERVCGIKKPKVGILSIGEEASKGNELTKAVYDSLKESSLNFVGNVEADHLYHGQAHVVVCDGFVGNVLLKASESISELIQGLLFKAAKGAAIAPEQLMQLKAGLKKFSPDAPEYSAAPLLGINGVSVVCHGKSKASVIANALMLARSYVSAGVVDFIHSQVVKEVMSTEDVPQGRVG
ncbi:MAG: phosphate--acyl-ACP acyltransferase [Candidatus Riflebacteria bacterium HGW-Riflebacteria-1]|jgi:glycerol-3-phosphate acyltransferase PlsX|nr:MAG: phosphate--acyl-ACP acyltransferase [Candidatus Riflebacteria bacterium HGW-Riflebacteria-1]